MEVTVEPERCSERPVVLQSLHCDSRAAPSVQKAFSTTDAGRGTSCRRTALGAHHPELTCV